MIHDRRRSNFLYQQGIQVVRFSNLEVLQQMDDVLEQIIRIAADRRMPSP
jgi:adenine-specific DNA-methyltransferase